MNGRCPAVGDITPADRPAAARCCRPDGRRAGPRRSGRCTPARGRARRARRESGRSATPGRGESASIIVVNSERVPSPLAASSMTRACWGESTCEAVLISQKDRRGSACRLGVMRLRWRWPFTQATTWGCRWRSGDELVARVPRLVRVAGVGRQVGHHVRRVVAEHDDVRVLVRGELLLEPVQLGGADRPVRAAGLVGRVEADGQDVRRQPVRVVEAGAVVVDGVPVADGPAPVNRGSRSAATYSWPVNGARRGSAVTWLVPGRGRRSPQGARTPPAPRSGWSSGVREHSRAARSERLLGVGREHLAVTGVPRRHRRLVLQSPECRGVVVAHRQQPGHVEPGGVERPGRRPSNPGTTGSRAPCSGRYRALGLPVLLEAAARDPLEDVGVTARGVQDAAREDREQPLELESTLVVGVVSGGHHRVDRPAGEGTRRARS